MKKLYFLFLFLFFFFNFSIAQNYYLYKNRRIALTEDTTINLICYINKIQGHSIHVRFDSIAELDQNIHVQQLRKNQFVVSSKNKSVSTIRKTYKNAYSSKLYFDSLRNRIFFLPQIILKLKKGFSPQKLLDEFKDKLILQSDNNGLCKFTCKVKNSDELLILLDKIYKSEGFKSTADWCEPVFYSSIKFFDDPLYSQQYYLKNTGQTGGTPGIDINVEPAWNITKGSPHIKIAVVDEGVEAHEDLDTNLLSGYTVGGGTGAPQNANSYDEKAHGEACAGIIAALHNNVGIKGIAPDCKILPVNIAPFPATPPTSFGFASNVEIGDALDWAWHHADILSCSWGGGAVSEYIETAIDSARTYGRNGNGCPVIFASGNNGSSVTFPGNYNGVITVGAIDKNGNIWSYSDRGPSMDFVAPSGNVNWNGDVVTLDRMGSNGESSGNYMYNFGGTSAACPQVAGVVALMLSVDSLLTESNIHTILQETAGDMGTPGFDDTYGYGLVNAHAAVFKSGGYITGPSYICTSNSIFILNNRPPGATVSWIHSSNLSYISGQGTNDYVVKATSSTTSGMGWVKAIASSSWVTDTIEKQVWVGVPGTPSITIIPPLTEVGPNSTIEVMGLSPGAENYNWTVAGGTITSGQGTSDIWIQTVSCTPVRPVDLYIQLVASNACGNSEKATKSIPFNCSGGPSPLSVSPNPASQTLNVEVTDTTLATTNRTVNKAFTVQMFDPYNKMVFQKQETLRHFSINVSGYRPGIYYLRVIKGNKAYAKKVIIAPH